MLLTKKKASRPKFKGKFGGQRSSCLNLFECVQCVIAVDISENKICLNQVFPNY